jgi:hypothetical protein
MIDDVLIIYNGLIHEKRLKAAENEMGHGTVTRYLTQIYPS